MSAYASSKSSQGFLPLRVGQLPNGTQDLKDGTQKYPPIPRANHLLRVRDYRNLEFSLLPSRLQENAEQALVAVTHCVAKGEPLVRCQLWYRYFTRRYVANCVNSLAWRTLSELFWSRPSTTAAVLPSRALVQRICLTSYKAP